MSTDLQNSENFGIDIIIKLPIVSNQALFFVRLLFVLVPHGIPSCILAQNGRIHISNFS